MIDWSKAPPGARERYEALNSGDPTLILASLRRRPSPRDVLDRVLDLAERYVAEQKKPRRAAALRIIEGNRK